MSKEIAQKKRKKSGRSKAPVIFIAIILIIGGVVGSNFVGPKKGWFNQDKVESKKKPNISTETPSTNSSEIDRSTGKPTPTKNIPKSIPPKKSLSGLEQKHAAFITEYLQTKKVYNPKKEYKLTTPNKQYNAFVTKVDEKNYMLHVRERKYNAKSSIHYSMLSLNARKFFFRNKAAQSYADKKLEKYLQEQKVIPVIDDEPLTSATTAKPRPQGLKGYDVTVTQSSPRLAHAALEVTNYLNAQVRVGKKKDGYAFADVPKCHAKQQGRKAILYLYVTSPFVSQNKEYKFQIVDGIRRFWALRCMSNGVAGASTAYLCIVHKDKHVGGSKLTDPEEIEIK